MTGGPAFDLAGTTSAVGAPFFARFLREEWEAIKWHNEMRPPTVPKRESNGVRLFGRPLLEERENWRTPSYFGPMLKRQTRVVLPR
jgi:hypothetical protein